MCDKCKSSRYRDVQEIKKECDRFVFSFEQLNSVMLDNAGNGWFTPLTREVFDRYSGLCGLVPKWITGDYRYEKAIEILDNARKGFYR